VSHKPTVARRAGRLPSWTRPRAAMPDRPDIARHAAERRARRAEDVRRKRGIFLYPVQVTDQTIGLMLHFGDLVEADLDNRQAVSDALGRFLRRAVAALLAARH
jgi:hypothetical protein